MTTASRYARAVPDTACHMCGGSTAAGRFLATSTAYSWRVCPTCDGLRRTEAVLVSAVRVRHGEQAAEAMEAVGPDSVLRAVGGAVQQFRTTAGGGGGILAPVEPWSHQADLVARLAEAAESMAVQKREEEARRVRPWPAVCLSCPAPLQPTPERRVPVCDDCAHQWGRTYDRLHGVDGAAAPTVAGV
ncbi:hypothetical protein [Streptomyces triticirhizae]|uniref:hypothetical protein n=1 Tax=Streptomyces triticirhizae TaxID=2483353 RepID=UPI0011C481D4|nr:hypothetical protein [Streptomyces triticirhizae]